MKTKFILFSLLFLSLQSCLSTRVAKTHNVQTNFSDQEIITLSKDCDYVNNLIANGMKKTKDERGQTRRYTNAYQRNDLLMEILIQTSCLEGQSLNQIKKQLGEPTGSCFREVCWGCQDNIQYDFIIDDANKYTYYVCSSDNQVTKILRSKWNIVTSH